MDAKLRALAGQMSQLMFEFMDAAGAVIKEKLYVAMHYQTVEEYFEQRIGFSWRSLRRRLAIQEAMLKLDDDEQADARKALIEVGIHRAAILAPVIGKPGENWRDWTRLAKRLDEDALQERVSKATGAKRRGAAAHARDGAHVRSSDEKWLEDTLKLIPEDARHEVAEVFAAGKAAHDRGSFVTVLLDMVRSVAVEWYAEAEKLGWRHREEPPIMDEVESAEGNGQPAAEEPFSAAEAVQRAGRGRRKREPAGAARDADGGTTTAERRRNDVQS